MTTGIDTRTHELLNEAAEWRLLSLLFECPSGNWRAQVEQLSTNTTDSQLRSCAGFALGQATEGLYHSIFGPGGPAPPREVSYSDTLQFGSLMSELQTYYTAFGYLPRTTEPPDHIAVETGFLAYLKLKEAFAHASGEEEHAALAAGAAERFISSHLSKTAHPLAESLKTSGLEYLAGAAEALHQRVGPPPAPVVASSGLSLPVLNDESAFACGPEAEDEAPLILPEA